MAADFASLVAAASHAHVAGKLVEAESYARQAHDLNPNDPALTLLRGVLAAKQNRDDEAGVIFQRLLELSPSSFEGNFWLSIIARRKPDLALALEHAVLAHQLRPDDAFGLNNLGLVHLDRLELPAAVECFRRAGGARPDMSPVFQNLGTALYMLGRDLEAAKAFDRALSINPRADESLLSLGQVMLSQTNPAAAVECARKALALRPDNPAALLLLASALVEDSRPSEAEPYLQRAIELDPTDAKALALLGMRFQSLGEFERANAQLRRSIELSPQQGFAYFAYVHNNKIREADRPMVEDMERIANQRALPPREQDFIEYGLGRAFENLGEYERAIRHYDEANRLAYEIKFGDASFDRDHYRSEIDRMIDTFDRRSLDSAKLKGSLSELPIVIVGMMRSGTTLAEQIISSHRSVGPAGEDRYWPLNWRKALGGVRGTINTSVLAKLAEGYITRLGRVSPGYERVTDKMPANYEFLGPIHASLPNARIIHMRRNPVDTCFSIYTTPNRVPVDFAYNRANIVFAYREYERLMQHWREVLPPDRFLEVVYEDLITDREQVTRRMIAFCGLEWDDACLEPERNERNVITPSLWQVRQPVYTSSIGRWERFRPWLGAFESLLEKGSE